MTATYWEVERRIVEFEQGGKRRAEYGEELLERLSRDLTEVGGYLESMEFVFSHFTELKTTEIGAGRHHAMAAFLPENRSPGAGQKSY